MKLFNKLFNYYSPLKSNKSLTNYYNTIINENDNSIFDIRSHINKLVYNNYLNEAVIKSSFTNEYLVKKSPKLNTAIYELNVGSSRADIVFINGVSTVYEIKTEFDSFIRFDTQLIDYKNHFDYINLIIPFSKVNDATINLDESVGIIYYFKNRLGNIKFTIHRKPKLNTNIIPLKQLKSLTKKELLNIIKDPYNYSLNKDKIINKILDSFSNNEINKIFKENIKIRFNDKWNFLYNNIEKIQLLDYQWFFKNNIEVDKVYR